MKYKAKDLIEIGLNHIIKTAEKQKNPLDRRKIITDLLIYWDTKRKELDRLWRGHG